MFLGCIQEREEPVMIFILSFWKPNMFPVAYDHNSFLSDFPLANFHLSFK